MDYWGFLGSLRDMKNLDFANKLSSHAGDV